MELDLEKLHSKIMELVLDFDQYCRDNDIEYFLLGGTALGAARHKGFIPWDDDFDVCMTPSNYFRFLALARDGLPPHLYLQEENTLEWPLFFSKVRMNGTTYIEKDVVGRDMHHGVFLDVMCLIDLSDNRFIRYLQFLSAKALSTKALSERGYITYDFKKRLVIKIASIIITRRVKGKLLSFVRGGIGKRTNYVGHFFGRASFDKAVFSRAIFERTKLVEFEGVSLPASHELDEYLRVRFGESYMRLPSEEVKDSFPSHAHIVDVNKDYKLYPEGGADG